MFTSMFIKNDLPVPGKTFLVQYDNMNNMNS